VGEEEAEATSERQRIAWALRTARLKSRRKTISVKWRVALARHTDLVSTGFLSITGLSITKKVPLPLLLSLTSAHSAAGRWSASASAGTPPRRLCDRLSENASASAGRGQTPPRSPLGAGHWSARGFGRWRSRWKSLRKIFRRPPPEWRPKTAVRSASWLGTDSRATRAGWPLPVQANGVACDRAF